MYLPAEDSFLLSETLKRHLKGRDKNIKILDLGTGSGIQAETCIKLGFRNVIAVDIDKEAVDFVKKKGIKSIQSDLFSEIKGKFDLIIFNPPYLPEDKHDRKKDTSGGKKGDETILRFLKQAKSHLNNNGEIFLLISSYTPKTRINNLINQFYNKKKISENKIFFENLEVFLFTLS